MKVSSLCLPFEKHGVPPPGLKARERRRSISRWSFKPSSKIDDDIFTSSL